MRTWPLVGRDDELGVLGQLVARDHRSVVVVAPAGTGKTRLLARFVDDLAAESSPVRVLARVTGTRAARTLPLAALAALLPADAPSAADPLELFRAVRRQVAEQRGDGAAVIIADDAHLLDPLSAALLHHLVTTDGVQVIAALRAGEPVEDAITAMWRDGSAERLDLQPLALDDLRALLEAVLGGGIDDTSTWRLWKLTGGNPLYAHEVVTDALAAGALRDEGGVWRWHGDARVGARLRELIHDRLDSLSREERELVDLLAVADRLDDTVVAALGLVAPVERMLRVGFVVHDRKGATRELALDHPLFAEVVRASMSAADRARWCRLLAEGSGSTPAGDTARLQQAVWQLDAGVPADTDLLVAAAEVANARFDGTLGARLATAALDAAGGARAELVRAEALLLQARYTDALAAAPEAGALAAAPDADDLRARLAMVRTEAGFWGLGRTAETDAALGALAREMSGAAGRQRVQALQSAVLYAANELDPAGALALPIATDARADDRARLRASTAAAGRQSFAGHPEAAYALCEELLPVGARHADAFPRGLGWVVAQMLVALNCLGRFDDVLAIVGPVRDAAIVDGDDEVVNAATLVLARMALTRGDLHGAESLLREVAPALRAYDPAVYLPWCLGLTAQVAGQLGDGERATAAIAELERLGDYVVRVNDHEVASGVAWAAAARGEEIAPGAQLVAAANRAAAAGNRFTAGILLHEALRLGAPARPLVDDLAQSCETGEFPCHEIFLAHARARADDSGDALDAVAARFEEAGTLLLGAEAASEAAAAHRHAGKPSRAGRSQQHAARLYARCPGARPPGDGPASRAQLTRREREIARLAAGGLSNQVIADTLHVNVRTVEGHLLRASAKLGVRRRAELAAALEITENA